MTEQLSIDVGPCTSKPVFPGGFYTGRPRPNSQSDEVLAEVANKLMPRVAQWLQLDEEDEEYQLQLKEYANDLLKALGVSRDGYKMANYLDDQCGWDVDSELVDIMDGADFYGCERQAVMAWIKDNDLKPKFEVGTMVTVRLSRDDAEYMGEIISIGDDGTYTVMIPALGHVRQGIGIHGNIFKWEAVEGWNVENSQ